MLSDSVDSGVNVNDFTSFRVLALDATDDMRRVTKVLPLQLLKPHISYDIQSTII